MKTTYDAIILGDKLTWIGKPLVTTTPTRVRVQIDAPALSDGREVARLLEEISQATGGIQSIPDPAAWQREQRVDRPLPGRE